MPASDRSYPSVWARPRRKERSTLTREHIVTEALRLLDTEGPAALSMRKLAAGLDAGATSLYWHVANRDELIELVIDEMYGEIDVPEPGEAGGWQAATRQFAHNVRAAVHRHPWVASMLENLVAAHLGPNTSRMTERLLAVFEAAGFPLPEAEQVASTVSAYILGVSMSEAAFHNLLTRRGQTAEDWLEASRQVAEETTKDHDRVREVVTLYESKNPEEAMETDFEYGLQRLLDGLQTRLDTLT